MPEKIGLEAIFSTEQWQRGLAQYLSGIQQAQQATDKAAGSMSTAGGAAGGELAAGLGISIGALAGLAAGALAAYKAMQFVVDVIKEAAAAAVQFTKDSIALAARFDELNLVAQLLGQRSGLTADEVDNLTQSIVDEGIRTDVASKLLIQFSRYNLDLAKSTELARVAQDAAVISMQDSSETLDQLIYGIVTYNRRVLRTAGINANINGSFQEYAKTLGKTSDDLTEAEKVQAALNAVLQEGSRIAGVYEVAMQNAGKQLRSLQGREIPELSAAFGSFFQPAFLTAVQTARDFVHTLTEAISEGGRLYPIMVKLGAIASIVADGLSDLAKRGLEAVINFLESMGIKFENAATSALEWGVNIAVSLADGLIRGAAIALTAAMNFISGILSFWLAPGSPPRVAPELGNWGSSAMEEWLHGFTQADFDILKGIQQPLLSALQILQQTGKIARDKVGKIFVGISRDLIQALSGGEVGEDLFSRIAKAAGEFGGAIADLARKEIELAAAQQKVYDIEKKVADLRKQEQAATDKVRKLTEEYNTALRAGTSRDVLKAKLAEINAAEEARNLATDQRAAAEDSLQTEKDRVSELQDSVKLQSELVQQLLSLAQAQIVPPEAKAGGAGAGVGVPALPDIGKSIGDFQNRLQSAVLEAKQKILDTLGRIFEPLRTKWEEDWQPILADLKARWDQLELDALTVWYRLFGPERGILTTAWNNFWGVLGPKITEAFTTLSEWLQTNIPKAGEAFAQVWEERIGPAMVDVWNWAQSDFFPFLQSFGNLIGAILTKDVENWTDAWDWLYNHVLEPFWSWLSGTFGPFLSTFKDDVLVPLSDAVGVLAGVWNDVVSAVGALFSKLDTLGGWLDTIAEKIRNMPRLSDFLGNSPSPLEIGVTGINQAFKDLTMTLDRFAGQAVPQVERTAITQLMPAAAAPIQVGGARTVNVNMGGVNVTSGMSEAQLDARIRRVVKEAIGI